jgi:hypothetical protein
MSASSNDCVRIKERDYDYIELQRIGYRINAKLTTTSAI